MRAARGLDRGRGRAARRRVAHRRPPGLSSRGSTTSTRTCARRSHWHARAGDGELLLRLATALWGFWSSRVYGAEGRRALEEALELSGRRPARTLLGLCTLRMLSGSSGNARGGRPGSAGGVRGAGRRLQPRPGLEPRRPRRGNRDGLARDRRGRLEAGALVRAPWQLTGPALAESISWLMVSAVFGPLARRGGDRPLPRVRRASRARTRRSARRARSSARCSRRCAATSGWRGSCSPTGGGRSRSPACTLWAALNAQETYLVETARGDAGGGRRDPAPELRRRSTEGGERAYLSTIAGFLAHALYAEGKDEEAERFSRESEEAAAPDDVLSQVLWRTARAKILAQARRARAGRGARARGRADRRADRSARHPRRRALRPRGGARARRPARGGARRARTTARSCTSGRET